VEFHRRGELKSRTGCDTTFTANTLCLDNVFVAHPYLEGTDGIALDRAGNIWNSANERNAIVVVTKDRDVVEVFRNPVVAGLRNSADPVPTAEANRPFSIAHQPGMSAEVLHRQFGWQPA
jgi:sugar lactone lactonase YvrE